MILVDTGPLVALFDPADDGHEARFRFLAQIELLATLARKSIRAGLAHHGRRANCDTLQRRWDMPLTEKELLERDAKRNIGEDLLQAIRDVKAGRNGAVYEVEPNEVAATRLRCGLSQAQFAAALRISPRTLQQWEQSRRRPSGAAETLLKVVARHPKILCEVI